MKETAGSNSTSLENDLLATRTHFLGSEPDCLDDHGEQLLGKRVWKPGVRVQPLRASSCWLKRRCMRRAKCAESFGSAKKTLVFPVFAPARPLQEP